MSGVVVLGRLSSGWTGTVTLTNASTSIAYVITPPTRTSPAAVWEGIVDRLGHLLSQPTSGWVTSADLKMHLATVGAVEFTIVATGTTQTRLALTGTYSTVSSVTTATAVPNLLQGSATGVDVPPDAYGTGAPAADGVLGSRPRPQAPTGGLTLYSTTGLSSILTLEAEVDDGETYDVFVDGRVVTRFRAESVVRTRWGRKATLATVDLGASRVSL